LDCTRLRCLETYDYFTAIYEVPVAYRIYVALRFARSLRAADFVTCKNSILVFVLE
jgi:hypothetical protein